MRDHKNLKKYLLFNFSATYHRFRRPPAGSVSGKVEPFQKSAFLKIRIFHRILEYPDPDPVQIRGSGGSPPASAGSGILVPFPPTNVTLLHCSDYQSTLLKGKWCKCRQQVSIKHCQQISPTTKKFKLFKTVPRDSHIISH